MASVAADHLAVAGRALRAGVGDVGAAQVGPLRLVLDADGVTAEMDRFDQGRADAGHRVQDQVAGLGVGGDGPLGRCPPVTGADVRVESFPTTVGATWVTGIYVGATQLGAG